MNTFGKIGLWFAGGLAALVGIGWLGLQIPPANFSPPADKGEDLGVMSLPADLPPPVRRYFQVAFGNQIPVVTSLAAWGRARAKFGIWMPLRFRLYHRAGYDFRREMEITWFGIPVLKALDQYLAGSGLTGPVDNLASGPETDQGANIIIWAEAPMMPSLLVADPRLRWEAIDDHSARLIFPFGDQEDELVFHFDPRTGLISEMTTMRYATGKSGKRPWSAKCLEWRTINGVQIPTQVAAVWVEDGEPWSYWTFDGLVWNVDVADKLPAVREATSQSQS